MKKEIGAPPVMTNYKMISPTALAIANSRTFSDIPFAREIFNTAIKIGRKSGDSPLSEVLRLNEVAPNHEARYKLLNKLLIENQQKQILEIASGLSPRGIFFAQQSSIKYVEMDLKDIILTKIKILREVCGELPTNLHLKTGNALNLADLKSATKHFDANQEIAIINEGFLRYLNFNEKATVGKNIYSLLHTFGGVWITSDITLKKGLEEEDKSISILKATKKITGIDINQNAFENQDAAKEFFENLGFEVEIHSFLEVEDVLVSPQKLKISKEKVRKMIEPWVVFVMRPQPIS